MPQSGKSTFIAALWEVVVTQDLPEAISLHALGEDTAHLNRIRKDWLEARPLEHTTVGTEIYNRMMLTCDEEEGPQEFVVPDFSGESLRLAVMDRQWNEEFDQFVRDSQGILLFIHPDNVDRNPSIADALEDLRAIPLDFEGSSMPGEPLVIGGNQEDSESGDGSSVSSARAIPWSHDMIPTDVQLVELLQLLASRAESTGIQKICVIVSAWDLVADRMSDPEAWLADELPLLSQFIRSSETFESKTFGVSAQGGKLPEESERLLAVPQPSHRIIVTDGHETSHDVTIPLRWLTLPL